MLITSDPWFSQTDENQYVAGSLKGLSDLLDDQRIHVICVTGRPGSGKTSTLFALRKVLQNSGRFTDGTFFLSLEKRAPYEVCQDLIKISKALNSGEEQFRGNSLGDPNRRNRAIAALAKSISNQNALIIFDNFYINEDYAFQIKIFARTCQSVLNQKLKVIVSSPNKEIEDFIPKSVVWPVTFSSEEIKSIFLHYVNRNDQKIQENDMRSIFYLSNKTENSCLFAVLAGKGIKFLISNGMDGQNAAERYVESLKNSFGASSEHFMVEKVLNNTVQTNFGLFHSGIDISMWSNIAILPANTAIPRIVFIACFFDYIYSKTEHEFIKAMEELGIISLYNDQIWISQSVHRASKSHIMQKNDEYEQKLHFIFLKRVQKRIQNNKINAQSHHSWYMFLHKSVQTYFHGNLIRHFSEAKRINDTLNILEDFYWTQVRLFQSNEISSLEGYIDDLRTFLRSLPPFSSVDYNETIDSIEEIRDGIVLMIRSISNSTSIVSKDPDELSFQIYGRMAHMKDRSNIVKRYLISVGRKADALHRKEDGVLEI